MNFLRNLFKKKEKIDKKHFTDSNSLVVENIKDGVSTKYRIYRDSQNNIIKEIIHE